MTNTGDITVQNVSFVLRGWINYWVGPPNCSAYFNGEKIEHPIDFPPGLSIMIIFAWTVKPMVYDPYERFQVRIYINHTDFGSYTIE